MVHFSSRMTEAAKARGVVALSRLTLSWASTIYGGLLHQAAARYRFFYDLTPG